MRRVIVWALMINCVAWLASGQSAGTTPGFEIADVRVSPKSFSQYMRTSPVRGGRYEIKNATMVDLIRTGYGYDADKILGGPSWLEMDRFDIIAKLPAAARMVPDDQKLMLQRLLQERFKLVVKKEDRPQSTYALTAGKKPLLKAAEGTDETGCRVRSEPAGEPSPNSVTLMRMGSNRQVERIVLGPGLTVQYQCRNMTMAAFASQLRGMLGASLGVNPVADETGLTGKWNFDVKWSMTINAPIDPGGSRITVFEAVEKQLGLRLEERKVPMPVIVVESVNRVPTENPPGVAEALPPIPLPTKFELASIRPSPPPAPGGMISRFGMEPGGRFVGENVSLRMLITRAFSTDVRSSMSGSEWIQGVPAFADSARFHVNAKAPSEGPDAPAIDSDALPGLIRNLLVERFAMKYHTEERPVTVYKLTASKPKLKEADPASRTFCRVGSAPAGSPPGSQTITCQNITMDQVAEQVQSVAGGISFPVENATGLAGGWDFSVVYSQLAMRALASGPAASAQPGSEAPAAPDPSGGQTIFEAFQKIGLKLEAQKKPMQVTVIDHLEEKPTEN